MYGNRAFRRIIPLNHVSRSRFWGRPVRRAVCVGASRPDRRAGFAAAGRRWRRRSAHVCSQDVSSDKEPWKHARRD